MQVPTIGRTTHYVTKYGKHRPGVIVEVHDDGSVDLQVLTGAHNDPPGSYRNGAMQGSGTAFVEGALQDEYNRDDPYTWHWPERVEKT